MTLSENLRKFLESDDPAMVRMGLSMAKGSMTEEMLGQIAGLYMWHNDKTVRSAAKSTFMKLASDELKEILKDAWETSNRTSPFLFLKPKVRKMFRLFKGTSLDTVDVWAPAITGNNKDIIRILEWELQIGMTLAEYFSAPEALRKMIKDQE